MPSPRNFKQVISKFITDNRDLIESELDTRISPDALIHLSKLISENLSDLIKNTQRSALSQNHEEVMVSHVQEAYNKNNGRKPNILKKISGLLGAGFLGAALSQSLGAILSGQTINLSGFEMFWIILFIVLGACLAFYNLYEG